MKSALVRPKSRIPRHANCQNCGQCCGIVPAYSDELAAIEKYIAANPHILDRVGPPGGTCPFRDKQESVCLIYRVRPVVCRLMGVVRGMTCPHGNSKNLDGSRFLPPRGRIDDVTILNFVSWKG